MKMVKKMFLVLLVLMSVLVSVNAQSFEYARLSETLLNQDPDPVEPGEYVELRFKVVKEGNEKLEDIKYELVPEYPFSFDNADSAIKSLGNWIGSSDDEEYYILYYKLRVAQDALEDTYELKLYQTSESAIGEKEIKFDVRVSDKESPELVIGNVRTSPSKLIANYDEGLVEVEIVNVGDEVAKSVIVEMNLPEGFEESFGYSTRANIGTISAGESKIASFYVDTNEGLFKGNHKSSLSLSYKEDDDNVKDNIKVVNKDFNISVFGRPEYELSDIQISNLTPGSKGEIRVKVKNIGSIESDSTSLQIFKDSSQPFEFDDKSQFIGKMDINSQGEVVFNLEVDEDAQIKDYKLKLQIRSVVDQDVLTEEEVVEVSVGSGRGVGGTQKSYINYAIYAVLLIVGLIVGYRFGLKNKNKK